ncbi:Chemotaxis signal transduction protein [Pseudomonas sp. NFACC23-1]|uniref:chemotaxis protein CheW n=1 Tax=unclassified Pseudomonas TaxID=196821 RepID=UPI00088C1D98|nr:MULTISPECIES: chemotaxis protein CheW [unclassified Pseudomonas]SDB11330.1 Chemotaxis signal transduction protein [Pseudomonas sp. NFACC17-2]SEI89512.1 Chemotaxis signal transduction protein [Pseudomonas sp. NFACC23-1]SFW16726.1 Chemotaxis signal transduction protein [Pseudomonas sp. NFACC16-2]
MGQLIDMHEVGFWLLLLTPGLAMLVWLAVSLWRVPRVTTRPVDPHAEAEPVRLEQLARQTIEQLNDASIALRRSLVDVDEHSTHEKPGPLTGLPVHKPGITVDKDFIDLADKMYALAELTTHLRDKKEALARGGIDPQLAAISPASSKHYLSFTLLGERFAINTLNLYAIVEASQLIVKSASTPKLHRAIRLRNTLVPVIDLSQHLAGRPTQVGPRTCVVILELARADHMQTIGVVVDAVANVLEISPADIEPPVTSDNRIRNDFALGTVTVNHHPLTVLDLARGLSVNGFILPCANVQPMARERLPS